MPKRRAYSYLRYSSASQAEGDSERRQIAQAQAWAAQHGFELDESHRDLGVSAYKGEHRRKGALGKFLDKAREGTIEKGSVLIVENLDRISREQPLEALELITSIVVDCGIDVVTLHDQQRYSKESLNKQIAQLYFLIGSISRAHEESSIKSKRIGEAMRQKRSVARRTKEPVSRHCPPWLDVIETDGKLAFVENSGSDVVRLIFTYTEDGIGPYAIAKRLNNDKIATFRNTQGRTSQWRGTYVSKLLGLQSIVGVWQPQTTSSDGQICDEPAVLDYYPAIVSHDRFEKVQNLRRNKEIPSGRKGTKVANLFQGIAKCDNCGGAMHLSGGNKKRPDSYFYCINKSSGTCMTKGMFNAAKVEDAILRNVIEWSSSPIFLNKEDEHEIKFLDEQIAKLRLDLNVHQQGSKHIGDAIAKTGPIDFLLDQAKNISDLISKTKAEIEKLEHDRTSLEHKRASKRQSIERMHEFITLIRNADDKARARSRLAAAIREVIQIIRFDAPNNVFDVILLGGIAAYRFGRVGNNRQPYTVINHFDLSQNTSIPDDAFVPHIWRNDEPTRIPGTDSWMEAIKRLRKKAD